MTTLKEMIQTAPKQKYPNCTTVESSFDTIDAFLEDEEKLFLCQQNTKLYTVFFIRNALRTYRSLLEKAEQINQELRDFLQKRAMFIGIQKADNTSRLDLSDPTNIFGRYQDAIQSCIVARKEYNQACIRAGYLYIVFVE